MKTKRKLRKEEIEPHIRDNREMKTKMGVNIYYQIFIPQDAYGIHCNMIKHLNKDYYSLNDAKNYRDAWILNHYRISAFRSTLPHWIPHPE